MKNMKRRLRSKILLAVVSGLCTLLLCEVFHRGWLSLQGRPHDAVATASTLRGLVDKTREFVPAANKTAPDKAPKKPPTPLFHPYSGSERRHDSGGVLEYFRKLAPGSESSEYKVLVVGGSVAAKWCSAGKPVFLKQLKQDPRFAKRKIRVLNYAHAAYKQPQQLMRVAYLMSLGYRPDAVINIDGFNEVAMPFQNMTTRTHPVYPEFVLWGTLLRDYQGLDEEEMEWKLALLDQRRSAQRFVQWALRFKLNHSSLLSQLALSRMHTFNRRRAEIQVEMTEAIGKKGEGKKKVGRINRQLQGPDYDPAPKSVLEIALRNWVESSRSLNALCTSRGIPYLHVLQPTLHDPGAKPFTDEERALKPPSPPWRMGAEMGYPRLREESAVLLEEGVRFHDASLLFQQTEETLYVDPCHLNIRGNELLAEEVAKVFLAVLED
jgi:hypothetical protein